jgi:hypothetical protein
MQYDATPLWDKLRREGRSMTWFAGATGYNRTYLHMIRAGMKPVTEKFMVKAAAALEVERASLFLPAILPEGSTTLSVERIAD